MKRKEIVIKGIVLIMVVAGLVMGLIYLISPTLMSYHFAFIGKTQDQLEPRVFDLFMVMKRVIGGHFLALSFGTLLLMGRLAHGDVYVRWSFLVMVLISQIILLYAGFVVHNGIVIKALGFMEIILGFIVFILGKGVAAGTE